MSTIYINTQGAVLRKEEYRFLVVKDKTVLLSIPDFKVERILLYGNVQVTTQALRFAMKNNIPITFLTMYGRFVGSMLPSFSKNIFLRMAQFRKLSDNNERVELSKKVIYAKIVTSTAMLKRFFRSSGVQLQDLLGLKRQLLLVKDVSSIDALRGIEGGASSIYFSNLRALLKEYIEFNGRNYHPAKDPFNSLLNFLYSLLANEVLGIIYAKGLDPYYGFLHSIEYGRVSLVFDLMEPFRSCVADPIAVKLFKKSIISREDFDRHQIYGYVLKNEPRTIVLKSYEERMEKKFSYNKKRINFREALMDYVNNFADYLAKDKEFKPFVLLK